MSFYILWLASHLHFCNQERRGLMGWLESSYGAKTTHERRNCRLPHAAKTVFLTVTFWWSLPLKICQVLLDSQSGACWKVYQGNGEWCKFLRLIFFLWQLASKKIELTDWWHLHVKYAYCKGRDVIWQHWLWSGFSYEKFYEFRPETSLACSYISWKLCIVTFYRIRKSLRQLSVYTFDPCYDERE